MAGGVVLGLDTSVVVRLLIGHPEPQARAARRRLERALGAGEVVLVSDLVIAEAYHALQFHYAVPEREARAALLRFVESGVVQVDPSCLSATLAAKGGAGFVDRLIHARHRSLGAATLTFDRKQGKLEGAVRLAAG